MSKNFMVFRKMFERKYLGAYYKKNANRKNLRLLKTCIEINFHTIND